MTLKEFGGIGRTHKAKERSGDLLKMSNKREVLDTATEGDTSCLTNSLLVTGQPSCIHSWRIGNVDSYASNSSYQLTSLLVHIQ